MYAEYLEHYGVPTVTANNADDAFAFAPTAAVIVTGIILRGTVDGIELIRRLRVDDRTKRTPIIVLTACVMQSDFEAAVAAGCDAFLRKPCAPDELLREIRRVHDRTTR
jgi:two-component system cell cycle response regulator DivK